MRLPTCCVPTAFLLVAAGAAQDWQLLLDRPPLYPALALDPDRDRVVMFSQSTGKVGIHEWDGSTWLATWQSGLPWPTNALPRVAYDPGRGVLVLLYGGGIWHYDGATLRLIATGGPGTFDAMNAAHAFDVQRGEFVYHNWVAAITYVWNGSQWRILPGRIGLTSWPSLGYDPVRGQVIAFAKEGLGGMFAFDGTVWNHIAGASLPATFPARDMAVCTDPVRNRLLVYGGEGSGATPPIYGVLWEWDGNGWSNIGNGPPRRRAALARHPGTGRLVLHGGDDGLLVHGDTWAFDGAFQRVEESPSLALTVTDPVRQRIVGVGQEQSGGSQHTWEWDGVRWLRVAGPHPRLHSLVFDASRGQVVGIENDFSRPILRTWVWSGSAWQLQSPPLDPPWQPSQSLSHDPVRGVLVMFGLHGTWEWDGAAWHRRTPANAPQMATSNSTQTSVFDPASGTVRLVLQTPTGMQEWEWNGSNWSQAPGTGLPTFAYGELRLDPRNGRVLLLAAGGGTWVRNAGTWTQITAVAPSPTTTSPDPFAAFLRSWAPGSWHALFADPATITAFGSGCGLGAVPWLAGLGRPAVRGADLRLDLGSGPAGAPAALYAALLPGSTPMGGGCTILLNGPVHAGFALLSPTGWATFPMGIPVQSTLLGLEVSWQAAVLQAGGPLLGGAALTNGVRVRLGH